METGEISLLSMVGGALAKLISCCCLAGAGERRVRIRSLADGRTGHHPARVRAYAREQALHRRPPRKGQRRSRDLPSFQAETDGLSRTFTATYGSTAVQRGGASNLGK